jgi:hypothetical protein
LAPSPPPKSPHELQTLKILPDVGAAEGGRYKRRLNKIAPRDAWGEMLHRIAVNAADETCWSLELLYNQLDR